MIAYKIIYKNESLFTTGKYCLEYEKGKITKALPKTLGIMCFDTLNRARNYLDRMCIPTDYVYKIYKVEGYNKNNSVVSQSVYVTEWELDDFYNHKFNPYEEARPLEMGAICFESVRLLEEIKPEDCK